MASGGKPGDVRQSASPATIAAGRLDIESMCGVQIWRSGGVQSYAEDYFKPVVSCLIYWALCEWHFGEIASCHELMDEAISIAKELKDRNALAMALHFSAYIAHYNRKTY